MVIADNLTGAAYLDESEEIEAYSTVWSGVSKAALSAPESRQMINDYRKRYDGR